ncbi:MAG: molybdenum cofactor biosynthesis protein MoaE, partial [Planctomycetia bacterium]|nr:molybdenum cofactor biosynthesis protein MoaE [Planctomycetia bacterium]
MASDPAGAEAVRLGREPIDPAWLLAAVADPAAGGNVLFLGTARGLTAGVVTRLLTYDAHEPLAFATLQQLRQQAIDRFGLVACAVWHRLGTVTPGAASVAVAASAAHRREAFAAAEWLMEQHGLEGLTASYDLDASQLAALLRSAPPAWFEVTIHQHMPMFHMEHCVFCAFLSPGKDYR